MAPPLQAGKGALLGATSVASEGLFAFRAQNSYGTHEASGSRRTRRAGKANASTGTVPEQSFSRVQ